MFMKTSREEDWLDVAGDIPLLGFSADSDSQIVFTPSVFSNVLKNRLTQTIDYRFMLTYDCAPVAGILLRMGYSHASGHANDDVIDPSLIPLNYDEDNLILRLIYSGAEHFRFGLTLSPVLNADPKRQFFSGNQFVEFFPYAQRPDHGANFFVATGIEEYGVAREQMSFNFQTAFYFGNHQLAGHSTTARIVIGGYAGPHPALKQFAYRNLSQSFLYSGLIVDL